jgi:hypothetical protein
MTLDVGAGHLALIDDQDYEFIRQYRWRPVLIGRVWYLRAWIPETGRSEYMHHLVWASPVPLCLFAGRPRLDHRSGGQPAS